MQRKGRGLSVKPFVIMLHVIWRTAGKSFSMGRYFCYGIRCIWQSADTSLCTYCHSSFHVVFLVTAIWSSYITLLLVFVQWGRRTKCRRSLPFPVVWESSVSLTAAPRLRFPRSIFGTTAWMLLDLSPATAVIQSCPATRRNPDFLFGLYPLIVSISPYPFDSSARAVV